MGRFPWLMLLLFSFASLSLGQTETEEINDVVVDLAVRGNGKVEADAILTLLKTQKGDRLDPSKVADDIQTLFDLGYFSDIRFFKAPDVGGVKVIVDVVEKPAIVAIKYEGMEEVSEDDLKDKIETKVYLSSRQGW
jgi:outer membrane protein insertion porin family